MSSAPRSSLAEAMTQQLANRHAKASLRALSVAPPNSIDFSSNDFLSLSGSSDLKGKGDGGAQTKRAAAVAAASASRRSNVRSSAARSAHIFFENRLGGTARVPRRRFGLLTFALFTLTGPAAARGWGLDRKSVV